MYFDESIKIDVDKLPQLLRDDYLLLKESFEKGDETTFDLTADGYISDVKNYCYGGRFDEAFARKLFKVIGIY